MLGKIRYRLKKSFGTKSNYLMVLSILSVFILVGSFSFALFTTTAESRGALNIVTGNLYSYIESNELNNTNTISLNSGETKMISLTLKNVNTVNAKYNLYYDASEGVNVSYDSTKDMPPGKEGYVVNSNAEKNYKLKLTNNTTVTQQITFGSDIGIQNKTLSFPEDKKAIESIIPRVKIDEGMIKVIYDEANSTWKKADNNNWYDYDFGRWANAVTVTSATRDNYLNATAGTIINMEDIETMWVWIPRYSYTIGSEDGANYYGKQGAYLSSTPTLELPGEIDIKFIEKSKKETGNAQYRVREGVSGFRTPDAFTFGDEELSGIWVGKFETSSSDPSATNGGGNVTNLDAMIKPNVTSWRDIKVANLAEVGLNMTKSGNRYGFTNLFDSHAMKNTEWGAASYLSQSKYGKLGNREFNGANKEIYQNKSNQYITGCSYGKSEGVNTDYGCQYTYDTKMTGTGASTTGTIYGIYDMSGGAWDIVMGNYNKYSGKNLDINSGYTGLLSDGNTFTGKTWLADKYYNFYSTDNVLTACSGEKCISHGLSEVAGWYQDNKGMVWSDSPWIIRGGFYVNGKDNGVFHYGSTQGNNYATVSFRLVLSAS